MTSICVGVVQVLVIGGILLANHPLLQTVWMHTAIEALLELATIVATALPYAV